MLVAICLYGVIRTVQAGLDARAGRTDLERAAAALRTEDVKRAQQSFESAQRRFSSAHDALHALGPLLPVSHVIPLVRVQMRGLETMSDVGVLLSRAGLNLTTASSHVLATQSAHKSLSQSLPELRTVSTALDRAVAVLGLARSRTAALDGYRLLGPLGSTRTKLEAELTSSEKRAREADQGVRLLLSVIGANGPRRLLVFSQNPDEVRPTGGFLGTYGVITGDDGHVRLRTYGDILKWVAAHPNVGVPVRSAPNAFKASTPPVSQGLANVNATPDWPTAAALAMRLWAQAGGQRVDGVVSLFPQQLARLVNVLGAVQVPRFGETVTAGNLLSRLNYYTHREAVRGNPNRKQFIVDLAHAVVQRVLDAPSNQWLDLGKALAAGFDAGDATMWSADPADQSALNALGWSGRFPAAVGDFYADAEFEYAAKNGSALKRTFTHVVTLRSDGSGVAATTMVLRDTAPAERGYNDDSLSYITPYGPRYSTLDPSSDKPDGVEPSLAGHPAIGYLRAAQPLGSMSLRVTWRSRLLAIPRTDGSLLYSLDFRGQPGHVGDVLHLTVRAPAGWHFVQRPPAVVTLHGDFRGAWVLRHN